MTLIEALDHLFDTCTAKAARHQARAAKTRNRRTRSLHLDAEAEALRVVGFAMLAKAAYYDQKLVDAAYEDLRRSGWAGVE